MRTSDYAYEQLRYMILKTELKPGQVIAESEMIKKLGVGRTPIREALNRLSWEQFVRIIPRQCIIVSDLPLHDLESIYQVRYTLSALEGELAATRRTKEDLESLKDIIERFRLEHDQEKRVMLDREFHRRVSLCTQNAFLINDMNTTLDLCLRLLFLNQDRLAEIDSFMVTDYEAIYSHIEAGRVKELVKALQSHVKKFKAKFFTL